MKYFLANQKQEFQMRLPMGSAILPVDFVGNDFVGQYSALFAAPEVSDGLSGIVLSSSSNTVYQHHYNSYLLPLR